MFNVPTCYVVSSDTSGRVGFVRDDGFVRERLVWVHPGRLPRATTLRCLRGSVEA